MRSVVLSLILLGGVARAQTPPGAIAQAPTTATDAPKQEMAQPVEIAADEEPEPSKKQRFLDEKAERREVRAKRPASERGRACLTVLNVWTREVLPLDPQKPPPEPALDDLMRDHFTNQPTKMDPRLSRVLLRAAEQFKSSFIEIVSAYRSPKYNLMLRKKGHAVARESQHPLGHAVDFRVAGVATKRLYKFVRALHIGGVGYYPHNGFVHADVGPIRTWKGE